MFPSLVFRLKSFSTFLKKYYPIYFQSFQFPVPPDRQTGAWHFSPCWLVLRYIRLQSPTSHAWTLSLHGLATVFDSSHPLPPTTWAQSPTFASKSEAKSSVFDFPLLDGTGKLHPSLSPACFETKIQANYSATCEEVRAEGSNTLPFFSRVGSTPA